MADAEKAGQLRAEQLLAEAIAFDGRKEWYCPFSSETNVWTRRRCGRCQTSIPSGLQRKCRQAVSAKAGRRSSDSSSSSGGENTIYLNSRSESQELREKDQAIRECREEAGNAVRTCG